MKHKPVEPLDYSNWTLEQHREYLETNERYAAYFALHNAATVTRFVKEYAVLKYDIFSHLENYRADYDQHKMQFLSEADKYIDIILQKKLFNLQCQWRAGMIKLPFVDICADFVYWQHHVRSCPFIAPITPEELDLCIGFLKEKIDHSEALFSEYIDWQNHVGFKNHRILNPIPAGGVATLTPITDYNSAIMPDIYHYFDIAQHTVPFLDLPDKRGQLEAKYLAEGYNIKYNSIRERLKTESDWVVFMDKPSKSDSRPGLHAFDPMGFVNATEDAKTKEAFLYYNHKRPLGHKKETDDETQMYFDFLKAFDEPIQIEASADWRAALALTARRFKQNKIAEMLPYAYDSHAFEFNGETDENKILENRVAHFKYNENDHYYKVLMLQKEIFLAARKTLDGKEDFDYL